MSEKFVVAVCDRLHLQAQLWLQTQPQIQLVDKTGLANADAALIRSGTKINEAFLQGAARLKVIVTATSGFDHIDLKLTARKNILVMHTPNANAQSAAEHTWGLIFAGLRKYKQSSVEIKNATWQRELLVGREVSKKTLGIVGLGRIGRKVARIAKAFDMQVYAFDPYVDESVFNENKVGQVSYEELLKLSDIVSYHVPNSPETKGMLSQSQFEYLHPDVFIVNASRGEVISEQDLIAALEQKIISGAALDVFEKEPLAKSSKLIALPNVFLTPHIGALTEEAFAESSMEAAQKVADFLLHGGRSDELPPKADWYGANPFGK